MAQESLDAVLHGIEVVKVRPRHPLTSLKLITTFTSGEMASTTRAPC